MHVRFHASWRGVSAVGCLLAASLISGCNFGGPVGADGLGCNGKIITAEDSAMSVHYNNLSSQADAAVTWARGRIDDTNVNTSSAGQSSTVDANVMDANWTTYCGLDWWNEGGDTLGYTQCMSLRGRECEKNDVTLDQAYMTSSGTTTALERNLVLHEMLHTLGLRHHPAEPAWELDIMYPSANGIFIISGHNVEHINGYY